MKFKTETITFNDIQPVWEKQLWPNRQSPIKPMSSMLYKGGYDMDIYNLYTPTFFAVLNNSGKIIGVNGNDYEIKMSKGNNVTLKFEKLKKKILDISDFNNYKDKIEEIQKLLEPSIIIQPWGP